MTVKTACRCYLVPFEIGGRSAFVLEFGNGYIRFYANHGQVVKNDLTPYEIESPYSSSDLWDAKEECYTLSTTQCGDVMYIFHPKYPIHTLTRYANDDWQLEELELLSGPWDDKNTTSISLSSTNTTGTTTISANGGNVFTQSDVGRLVRLNLVNDETTPWSASLEVENNDIVRSDGSYYKVMTGGTTGSVKPVHHEGTRSDGKLTWEYLHSGSGTAKITQYISPTSVEAEILDYMPDNITTADWELGLFHQNGTYPVAGTFWSDRFVIFTDTTAGPKIIPSYNADFTNFADMEYGEQVAECSFVIPVLSDKYNQAKWIAGGDILAAGTSSGEFYVSKKSSAEAWSFDNTQIMQISQIGNKQITPIKINGHMLFTDKFGTSIRDLVYSYERDTYDPFDTTICSKHLLLSGIVDWAYQDYPDKILWCVVGDGRLIGYTFNSEQEVSAMHQHNLSGYVESIAVITSPDENRQDVWVVAKRTIEGVTQRYIEWLDEGMKTSYPNEIDIIEDLDEKESAEADYVKQNAFYVDSGLIYNRTPGDTSTVIGGLKHLVGMEVAILADGAMRPKQIVNAEGEIEIEATDSQVICGLPIKSIYKSQKLVVQGPNSSGIGDVQKVDHLTVMLYRSAGGKIGGRYDNLTDMLYRHTDDVMDKSTDLFTGNLVTPWPEGSSTLQEKGATILIYNDSVFPMNILAIVPSLVSKS